jgi:hypothetical protein
MADVKVKSLISLVLASAIAGFVAGCGDREAVDAVPARPPETENATVPSPALPLTRADFIAGAAAAAGAYAVGTTPGEGDPLVGRSFSVSLPFGCGGPKAAGGSALDGLAQATWQDADRQAIVLALSPADWTESALITGSGAKWESVEGHWIDRAWLLEDRCPTVRSDPLQIGAAFAEAPSVGLAGVHEAGASRLNRRDGRAYRHVLRGPDGAAPAVPPAGWRVRIEGRIVSFPDGRAFRCRAPGPDARPTCVAATAIDRVAFETADGVVLSQWRPG